MDHQARTCLSRRTAPKRKLKGRNTEGEIEEFEWLSFEVDSNHTVLLPPALKLCVCQFRHDRPENTLGKILPLNPNATLALSNSTAYGCNIVSLARKNLSGPFTGQIKASFLMISYFAGVRRHCRAGCGCSRRSRNRHRSGCWNRRQHRFGGLREPSHRRAFENCSNTEMPTGRRRGVHVNRHAMV